MVRTFLDDIGPLVVAENGWDPDGAMEFALNRLAVLIPGEPWQGKTKKPKGPAIYSEDHGCGLSGRG